MCGIAGILADPDHGPVGMEELGRMAAILSHRGPDGHGFYRDHRVGLAHTRLSIIDLSGGAQPIHNEDSTVWISFNGEIFNYPELRGRLEGLGHRFYTNTDTEVIIHAYEQFGKDAWEKLNGQFAFALWDSRMRQLWLVRDRLGILPLHYARTGGRLTFASEAKAIFASGNVDARLDPIGLHQVFTRWSATGPATVFQGVKTVMPGTALLVDEHLREVHHRYWEPSLLESHDLRQVSKDDAADMLDARLAQAVRLRLRADVPVGAYLSGGLDSSLISSLVRSAASSPLQTFAIRFENADFDETPQQRFMAQLLRTQHHETLCGDREIAGSFPDVVWHCETPLLRTAPVPLFLLSSLVRDNGMKVVLTGEGADELLAGYSIFKEDKVRRFWARQPASVARPLLFSRLHSEVRDAQRRGRMWQVFFRRGLNETDHPFYSHLIRWRNTAWTLNCLSADLRNGAEADQLEQELAPALPASWNSWPPLARAQWIEITTFLSSYLLCSQGDRMAMAHGVEVRYPYLDPEVADFCNGLPGRLKLCGLSDKVLLRHAASRRLPPDIWRRPKKPYRAPMTSPFFGPGAPDYVQELLSPGQLNRLGLVDCRTAGQLVDKARRQAGNMSSEREEMALIGILSLQLLGQQYLAGMRERTSNACLGLLAHTPGVLVDRTNSVRVQDQ